MLIHLDKTTKYQMVHCPKCNIETLHKCRKRVGQRKDGGAFLKRVSKKCRVCNHIIKK